MDVRKKGAMMPPARMSAPEHPQKTKKTYIIEKVVKSRGGGTRENTKDYLIRWKGYSKKYDSWEPAETIERSAHLLVDIFWEMQTVKYVEQRVKKINSLKKPQAPTVSKSAKRSNAESTRYSKRIKAKVEANKEGTKIKSETTAKIPPKHPANPEIPEQKQKDVENSAVKLATELNVEDIKMILENQTQKILTELKSHINEKFDKLEAQLIN